MKQHSDVLYIIANIYCVALLLLLSQYQNVATWQFFHPETTDLAGRNVSTQFYLPKPEYNIVMDEKKNPHWMDYKYFDPVSEMTVESNKFFAFAPNNHSFHGAAIDPTKLVGAESREERQTYLLRLLD